VLNTASNLDHPADNRFVRLRRQWLLPIMVGAAVIVNWLVILYAGETTRQSLIQSYLQHTQEVVRLVARSVTFAAERDSTLRPSQFLREFVAPVDLDYHSGMWVFANGGLIYFKRTFEGQDLLTPAEKVFQAMPGARGYEPILEGIRTGTEGTATYRWRRDDGDLVVAWTVAQVGGQQWVIGMPTRIDNLTAETGADDAHARLIIVGVALTFLVGVLTVMRTHAVQKQIAAETTLADSNRLLAVLIESSPFAVVAVDGKNVIRVWNAAAETLFACPSKQAIGQPITLINRWVTLGEFPTDTNIPSRELRYMKPDGSSGTLRLAMSRMREESGRLHGMVFFMEDITQRKAAEDALRASEAAERQQREWLQALGDTMQIITSDLNLELVMQRVLEHMERVVPHDAACILLAKDGIMALAYWRNLPPSLVSSYNEAPLRADMPKFQQMAATGHPRLIADVRNAPEWTIVDESDPYLSHLSAPMIIHQRLIGTLNLDSLKANAFTASDAERLRVFAAQVTIAIENARLYAELSDHAADLERRVAERTEALTAANKRLQHADMLKTKFISDISHELRTPVTSLNTRLFLLERDTPERRQEHLNSLKSQLRRLNRLLEDVLNFARFEAQITDPHEAKPINLNSLVEDVVKMHGPAAELKGLSLSFLPDQNMPEVRGHMTDLFRAISNLVVNAVNYTQAGSIRVTTAYNPSMEKASIEVTDTGMGIAPEDMPHLFERFYRGKSVGSSTIPGTGLGLALVKEIVEKHHGSIEVKSVLGEGSTFRIVLPTKTVAAPA
jgi:PAS domain S-box-containing protein